MESDVFVMHLSLGGWREKEEQVIRLTACPRGTRCKSNDVIEWEDLQARDADYPHAARFGRPLNPTVPTPAFITPIEGIAHVLPQALGEGEQEIQRPREESE